LTQSTFSLSSWRVGACWTNNRNLRFGGAHVTCWTLSTSWRKSKTVLSWVTCYWVSICTCCRWAFRTSRTSCTLCVTNTFWEPSLWAVKRLRVHNRVWTILSFRAYRAGFTSDIWIKTGWTSNRQSVFWCTLRACWTGQTISKTGGRVHIGRTCLGTLPISAIFGATYLTKLGSCSRIGSQSTPDWWHVRSRTFIPCGTRLTLTSKSSICEGICTRRWASYGLHRCYPNDCG
jgi:hypothetical protein